MQVEAGLDTLTLQVQVWNQPPLSPSEPQCSLQQPLAALASELKMRPVPLRNWILNRTQS